MRPITKTAIAAGVAAVIWIGVHNMPSAGSGPTKPAVIDGTWPSPTPSPTEPPMIAAVSTPHQSPPMPLLWPSPPTYTEEQLRDIVRKEMEAAAAKALEDDRRRRDDEERRKIAPVPANPFESDEDRAAKARKYGFVLQDADGAEWARIHREDGDDITKGLLPENTVIASKRKPTVEPAEGGWRVTFALPAKENK